MQQPDLVTAKHPKSPSAEAFRTLRTNIQFSSFDKDIKTIVVTSSGPGEGKTTTASNLAIVVSQGGHRTLLIDCDMRKPNVHKTFKISNEVGLTNVLIGEAGIDEALQVDGNENLYILTSGARPPNPAEITASSKMQRLITALKEKFEYIIIDTPPVMVVTDAQILSKYADGCLLVVSSGQTDRDAAVKAKELLEKVDAKILGVVLNKLDTSRKGYYGYYYHYYYGNDGVKKVKTGKKLFNFFKKKHKNISS